MTPSLAISTLSYGEVCDADALGYFCVPGLYARLLVGNAGGSTGQGTCPHTSISVRPVRAPSRCVNVTRNRSVSTLSKDTVFARRPSGFSSIDFFPATARHALP